MNAVPFDTLKMAQRLEAAGFTRPQADGAAEALAEALLGADLATKGDVAAVRADVGAVRVEVGAVREEVGTVEVSLKAEIANAEARFEARLNAAIELLRRDITIKFGSMLMVAVGVILAAIRYLPPHP